MAKYDITYSCGHEDRITLFGPSRDRERKIEWYETHALCADCYHAKLEADRAQATAEAAAQAVEIGLPPLTGTPKQIAWAERIRAIKIEQMESRELEPLDDTPAEMIMAAVDMLGRVAAIPDASWWIDHREDSFLPWALIKQAVGSDRDPEKAMALIDAAFRTTEIRAELNAPDMQEAEAAAKAEATIRPENPLSETVAEITVSDTAIDVIFPERRDDFRELIRFKLGYTWIDDRWRRGLSPFTGSARDRAIELAHRLLAAHFCVRVYDPEIRDRALTGDYEPECKRWIKAQTAGSHAGKLVVTWPRGEDFYAAARKIPGSRYHDRKLFLPAEQFEQILDFAERYQFSISPAAQTVLTQARAVRDAAITCAVTERHLAALPTPGDKPAKLPVPENVQVADEFQD